MNKQNETGQAIVDQHVLDLLNRGIDGELSVTEQDELDRLISTSPAVRNLDIELRVVTRMLDELPQVEPPQYLQETIERQVRLPAQSTTGLGKPGLLRSWLNTNWLRTGFALAAGVVLTVSVYEMGSEPITATDSATLTGTIAKMDVTGQQGVLLDRVSLATDGLNGLVELRHEGDLLTLDVQLTSDGPSELVVNFAGRGLEFDGVTRLQDPGETVSVADGVIHFASPGEQHFTVNLRRVSKTQPDVPLLLEFFSNSELVQQSELNISKF